MAIQIKIYIIPKHHLGNDITSYFFQNYLSSEEKKKFTSYHSKYLKNRFLLSRVALKKILTINYAQQDSTLNYGEYGKPFFKNSNFSFNISHTENYTVIGTSLSSQIGIDIEEVNTKYINSIYTSSNVNEKDFLKQRNNIESYYIVWTRKEAFLKLKGTGFLTNYLSPPPPFKNTNDTFLYSYKFNKNIITVATNKEINEVQFLFLNFTIGEDNDEQ
ncbi:4'-phosphopantetheinyl transferase family protein [Staphylococcus xylosus]|uniref:4'-phosphopantetheinyl transferase family protein n=1 Tax=Staphylococcus xylosus TaxID=1288 RepID=UPI003F57C726